LESAIAAIDIFNKQEKLDCCRIERGCSQVVYVWFSVSILVEAPHFWEAWSYPIGCGREPQSHVAGTQSNLAGTRSHVSGIGSDRVRMRNWKLRFLPVVQALDRRWRHQVSWGPVWVPWEGLIWRRGISHYI